MATTVLLVRHASHDWLGRGIAGRLAGVSLNARGQAEAEALAHWLIGAGIAEIVSSPRERARETAAPLARRLRLAVRTDPAMDEVEFGAWTGKLFAALEGNPEWRLWCDRRSIAQPPEGETIMQVQARIVGALSDLATARAGKTIAIFSHGDVIKAALAHYLGMSLDGLEKFDIAPASVSILAVDRDWSQVKCVNDASAVTRASTAELQSPGRG